MCTGGSCFVTDKGRDLKKARASRALEVLAEAVGFEPTVPFGTTVFKTASLSHSDTPPHHRAVAAVRRTRRTGYHIPLRLWGIACFAALRGGCLRGTAYNSLHERTSHTRRATGAGRPVYGAAPAYAGKRQFSAFPLKFVWDHPRLCGEKLIAISIFLCASGSPPPMRGKVVRYDEFAFYSGITPAYAGKSLSGLSVRLLYRDHPRLCGEKSYPSVFWWAF